jgi:hypothetical protein
MKIIKQIDLIIQNRNEIDVAAGIILYEREFSESYGFKEKQKEEKDFFHFVNYPKQEDYPHDDLDSMILEAIKLDFPKVIVKSDLLFSSRDVEHYEHLTNRPHEVAELNFIPDFTGIKLEELPQKSFNGFRKEIKIYVNGSTEVIKNRGFRGYCDFETHEEIYERLDKISFR